MKEGRKEGREGVSKEVDRQVETKDRWRGRMSSAYLE